MARALIRVATGHIGQLVHSMLTLAQFQAQYGTGWVIADGTSCTGTAYASMTGATTLPDARGVVIRGKNNGRADGKQNPDGELALGTFQTDQFASHSHSFGLGDGSAGGFFNDAANGQTNPFTCTTSANGGNETRMKSITGNIFIRVN